MLVDCSRPRNSSARSPAPATLLVEESPDDEGLAYAFHAPLSRSACEAWAGPSPPGWPAVRPRPLLAASPTSAGRSGLPEAAPSRRAAISPALLDPDGLADDVLEGLDRGELLARRFRHVAATALMVLRNPEGGRERVGGLLWVSSRLYPAGQGRLPRPPPAPRDPPGGARDLLDTAVGPGLAGDAAVESGSASLARRLRSPRPGSPRRPPSRCGSSRPPTPSAAPRPPDGAVPGCRETEPR